MKRFVIAILAIAGWMGAYAQMKPDQFDPGMKLRYAEAIIENYYVEDINIDSIVDQGIISMLKTLDPHSAYSTPDETRELNEPLEGKFSGIGVQFNMSTDTVYVIQTIAGGPSEKVGIRPGDRIIAADDSVIAGKKLPNSKVMKVLRGPKGSKVKLTVVRKGEPTPIEFVVTRDDIPVYSVDGVYMIDDNVGYIRLTRFAEDSGKEVAEAIKKLKKRGMTKLILDLEDNGGGYLKAAVDIASLFLNHGDLVVYTQGQNTNPSYFRVESKRPLFDGDLVIMVNQYSASASEILSGAVQDHDRGTIVGRRTFGKGLVQRPFPFPDGSMIRLTVAKYYTPSGRSIQKHYDKGHGEEYQLDMLNRYQSGELWSADSVQLDKSQVYKTLKKHRTVYGGGGIMPDVFVPVDTSYYTPYYRDLMSKGVITTYTINYVDKHRQELRKAYPTEDAFFANFSVGPEIIAEIVEAAKAEGVEPNDEQLAVSRPIIEAIVMGLLTRDLYDDGSYVRATNPYNPVFVEAVKAIKGKR